MMDKTMLNLTVFVAAASVFKLWGLYKGPIGLARTKDRLDPAFRSDNSTVGYNSGLL